jgi:hypothetical protein
MALGTNFYANQDQMDAASLSRRQGNESLSRGYEAANLSDPFASQRPQYQTQLATLMSNPGQIETSPFYKYLQSTQMEGVKASNAARGFTNSGRGLMALQDRAAGVASQAYFPQAQLLSLLSGATTGSPAAAGYAFTRGSERSQDYKQQSLAQKNYQPPSGPAQRPWYDTPFFNDKNYVDTRPSGSTGLPSGGYQQSYDYYQPSYSNQLPADYLTTNDSGGNYLPDESTWYDDPFGWEYTA